MFGLSRKESVFGLLISSLHTVQHVFYRLVPPLIPILAVDLSYPLWQLGLLVSIYMFFGGLFQAPFGILADSIDRIYIAVPSVLLMALGYLLFALSTNTGHFFPAISIFSYYVTGTFQIMALAMAIAGIGYSGIHPVGYPLITENISDMNKGSVLGMWGSASKIGDAIAPILVGVFIIFISWEWILVGIAMGGIVYAAWLATVLKRDDYETKPPTRRDGESDDQSLLEDPRRFLFPISVAFLLFLSILFVGNGLLAFAPVFVADVYAFSITIGTVTFRPESVANFYFAVLLLSATVSQLIAGMLADTYDHRALIAGLLTVSTMCLVVLSVVTLGPISLLIVFGALGGCLFGINPIRDALISDISPPEYEGRTFGYIYTVALLISSAVPTIIGYTSDTIGIQYSFGVLAIVAVVGIGVIALLWSPRIYRNK